LIRSKKKKRYCGGLFIFLFVKKYATILEKENLQTTFLFFYPFQSSFYFILNISKVLNQEISSLLEKVFFCPKFALENSAVLRNKNKSQVTYFYNY
jgi:hypothetical protein